MLNLRVKNWRVLVILFLLLAFFGFFCYFFIVKKNVIKVIKPVKWKQPITRTVKVKQNSQLATLPKLEWSRFKTIMQRFLTTLTLDTKLLLQASYKYRAYNNYWITWQIIKTRLEQAIIYQISQTVAFFDLVVKISYKSNLLAVRIVINVVDRPTWTVSQTYTLRI